LKPLIAAVLIFLLALAGAVEAERIAGVEVPVQGSFAGHELKLKGAGVREQWFMDIYVGGLYLPESMAEAGAREIIESDQPMAIRLMIVSGMITSAKLKEATMEGLNKSMDGDIEPIKAQVERFLAGFDEEIAEGDQFDIVHDPAKGVLVYKNGVDQGIVAEGDLFKRAVFGIWLSDDPVQSGLKEGMLGR